ncbi:MAG: hypothetical protein IMF18_14180 [Proteobacteria bacterium]|nr:hypothetical protein [Pseudomonadota bacterium]
MISKVELLKIIGKFYDCSAKGAGLDWHKNTFLFAPSAYGKSRFVNVCQSVRDNNPKLIRARKTLGASPEGVIIIYSVNHVFNGTKWTSLVLQFKYSTCPLSC